MRMRRVSKAIPPLIGAAMHGTDPDLAAHFTVIRSVGRALWGKPISAVFGDVPREAYLRSILADVSGAENDVASVYIVLNLCRVLAYAQDGMVLSKAAGRALGAALAAGGRAVSFRRRLQATKAAAPFCPGRRCFPSLRPFYAQQNPFAALSAKKEPRVLRDSFSEYR